MWGLSADKYDELILWNGSPCSGDWCGDMDTKTRGHQRGTDFFYRETILGGNNVAFLDGHVKFMTDEQMTAGINYWSAGHSGPYGGGGAVITDKRKYLWNLDDNYYGG